MPLPEKLDKVPPVAVTSAATKLLDDSVKVNVSVVVSPRARLDLLLLTEIVGGVSSTRLATP